MKIVVRVYISSCDYFTIGDETMKHIRYILSMILVGTILLCGCSSKKDSLSDTGSQNDSELSSIISSDDELIKKSDGTVTMGF